MSTLVLIVLLGACSLLQDDNPPTEADCVARGTFYPDTDGDGIGEPGTVYVGCDPPEGYVDIPPSPTLPGDTDPPDTDPPPDTDQPVDTDPPDPCREEAPVVVLSNGCDPLVDMEDGGTVEISSLPGQLSNVRHIGGCVHITNGPQLIRSTFVVTDTTCGEVVSNTTWNQAYIPDAPGEWACAGRSTEMTWYLDTHALTGGGLADPDAILHGHPVRLDWELRDVDGEVVASGEKTITANAANVAEVTPLVCPGAIDTDTPDTDTPDTDAPDTDSPAP